MEWVVVVSVLVMTILSLLRVNVVIAIIIAALTGGVMSGLSIVESIEMLVEGMGGGADTALSYILLGAFAVAIGYTGITSILVRYLIRILTGKKTMMILAIAGVASLSQNLVPVHIAFIPILIPPLLKVFDQMHIDRRAVATALTFGLKAPYVMIPAGFGLIFHGIIVEGMEDHGISITVGETALAMLIPGLGMVVGLLIAVFITYRKDRDVAAIAGGTKSTVITDEEDADAEITFSSKHFFTLIAIVAALAVQIVTDDLVAGALTGLILMFLLVAVPFKAGEKVMSEGVAMMGMIAFVMFVANGYGNILTETGAVD